MTGWVSIHRQMMNNKKYFSEKFCRNMAWIDMIMLANHDENSIRVRGILVPIKRGQIGYTSESLAKRWKWSRGKVLRFISELEIAHQIALQKNNVTTLISILNYNQYQDNRHRNGTTNSTTNSTTERQQTDINNNGNKENKVLNTVNLIDEKNEKNSSGEHLAISGTSILAARVAARKSQGINGG